VKSSACFAPAGVPPAPPPGVPPAAVEAAVVPEEANMPPAAGEEEVGRRSGPVDRVEAGDRKEVSGEHERGAGARRFIHLANGDSRGSTNELPEGAR